jgi:co-chaperonin GroES (HSP10)
MAFNFHPTRDWVVLPLQKENKTESGILLTGGAEHTLRKNVMKVIAAGPSCEQIKAGDTVMVHPTTEGLVIDVNGEDYVMVNEFSICGRFE